MNLTSMPFKESLSTDGYTGQNSLIKMPLNEQQRGSLDKTKEKKGGWSAERYAEADFFFFFTDANNGQYRVQHTIKR